jgi:type II secretory pathway pseudopilin PulG
MRGIGQSIGAVAARVRRTRSSGDDAGFTLVELLIASFLGLVVGALILSTVVVAQRSANTTTSVANLNGEARILLNRMTGDIRQAMPVFNTDSATGVVTETPAITGVQDPGPGETPGSITSITFNADFSGDGCIAGIVSDGCPTPPPFDQNYPESETFCWDPGASVVYLIAGDVQAGTCKPSTTGVTAQPLLSGKVTGLEIDCDSSSYLYDANRDGVTTWQELDAAGPPVGNGNDVLDTPELTRIDSLKIVATVFEDGHSERYQTLVSIRNVS